MVMTKAALFEQLPISSSAFMIFLTRATKESQFASFTALEHSNYKNINYESEENSGPFDLTDIPI